METAPSEIDKLVHRFADQRTEYESGKYKETSVRVEFIDPLLEALGWDIKNKNGASETYKDVVHEDSLKVGGDYKAPDYSFRIAGARKFFLEAKKPSINVLTDRNAIYQLRRYGWSAKLPISVLTNFAELCVYDCRLRPKTDDHPDNSRLFTIKFSDILTRWSELSTLLGRDAVAAGSLDRLAATKKIKRGLVEVDGAFLSEIEKWRDLLARNLALRNPKLSSREMNHAVQATIDRIVFLRICEDRGIEDYGQLKSAVVKPGAYNNLLLHFRKADKIYNSGLFHFEQEADRAEPPDAFTTKLSIDDAVLKDIISDLYYPESPYAFAVLPADILGQVYEQFLGRIIRLTAGHRAVIEEKPEVKKAGGVYYTPTYIAEFIVRNTVASLVEGKTPQQVSKLRILDPSCGSGSFLLVAYQFLLDWHLQWYEAHQSKKKSNSIYRLATGGLALTIAERKRILLNNIFGVDIDSQAVEVTKLSLLLKVLEAASRDVIESQYRLFHERALPDLGDNIKCGNSLVSSDFYETYQPDLLDEDRTYKLNVFDWANEFPAVMAAGGFNSIIGNPPYLYSAGQEFTKYFEKKYKLSQYQTDYYVYFIERSLSLLAKRALFSYIVSDSWLNSGTFSELRNHLLQKHKLKGIAVFDYPVFKKVTLENSIFILEKDGDRLPIPITRFKSPDETVGGPVLLPDDAVKRGLIDPRYDPQIASVVATIDKCTTPLCALFEVNRGIHAYRVDGYGTSKFRKGTQTKRDKDERSYHSDAKLDKTYLPEIRGQDVFRFRNKWSGKYLSYGPWLAEPREPRFFNGPKVIVRKIVGERLSGTFVDKPAAIDQSLYILLAKSGDQQDLLFILGILLSRVGAWYIRSKHSIFDALYPWYTKKNLDAFPIPKVDPEVSTLVARALSLNIQIDKTKTVHEQKVLQRQLEGTEKQIDQLVFNLYGLSPEQIAIIEKGGRNTGDRAVPEELDDTE